jgi:1-acyl-sn-glycerol-3-phosphate acyltransferase
MSAQEPSDPPQCLRPSLARARRELQSRARGGLSSLQSAAAKAVMRYALRRALIIPAMLVVACVMVATLPAVALGQAIVAALLLLRGRRPRWRALRLAAFAAIYGASECAAVLVCLLLWVASPVPRWRNAANWRARHVWLLGSFLGTLLRMAQPIFGFRLRLENPRRATAGSGEPVIALSRHAGPGASFALIHVLLRERQRVPRIVLKAQLRLDPALDLVLTRIGCAFIRAGSTGAPGPATAIARLAADLRPGDAMLIFPEGMDWTPTRHRLAVRRLRRKGLPAEAAAAAAMPNVLPPHPGGTFAALQAAPGSELAVFVHTGHDQMVNAASIWRALPLQRELHMAWWNEPGPRVASEEDCAVWLNDLWSRIDAWIEEQAAVADLIQPDAAAP